MQLISNRYIPTEEVRRLTIGSYEHLIARIDEAVRSDAARLFGAKIEAHVVGTFSGYAIVLAEDGRFLRIKYDEVKGSVRVVGHEMLKVASYSPDELGSYLKSESQRAVDSLLRGNVEEALSRLKGLTRFVERRPTHDEPQIVEAMATFYRSDRLWRRVFQEKADHIRRMVLDEITAIHEDRLQVKFRSLYDGSVSATDLESYRELVIENLNQIGERTDNLLRQVTDAAREAKGRKDGEAVVTSLFAFADDLVEDLRSVKKTASESTRQLTRVDCLGKFHDTLAEGFRDRELASRFVIKMSKRLGEANP
jgi:hypothetical protein